MVTPFTQWKAYQLGIIDAQGNVLRPRRTLKTSQEKEAWGRFDIAVANLKKALAKVPGGQSKLANMAAAAWIFKESEYYTDEELSTTLVEDFMFHFPNLTEEGPTNSAGSGAIAGIGVGPDGEPPMGKAALMSRQRRRARMLKRFYDAQKMWLNKAEQ
jgi:hypothetical protein